MIERLVIRELHPTDAIASITALLHAAYATLAKQGMRYWASYQDDTATKQRLRDGFPFVAELEGAIVATVTLYAPLSESLSAWYRQPDVYHFGQFAVQPDLQRHGIGRRLIEFIEEQSRQRSAKELALDTAENATQLREWYERLGYRFIEYVKWERPDYRSVVLSKQLTS